MDFEIPPKELKKRKRRRFLIGGLLLSVVVFVVFAFRLIIQPSVEYSRLRTAVVERGDIYASLTAAGTVVPEFEELMVSPLKARIDSVYHPAGAKVKKGTPILKLDLSETQNELEKLEEALQKKRNEATLIRLRMEKSLAELKSLFDIKNLYISSLENEVEGEKYMLSIGGGRPEDVRKAELNLKVAQRELQKLEEQIDNQRQTNEADMVALQFDIRIEKRNVQELLRHMQQAEIRAERDGVIVFVKDQIGASVQEGEELVRLADLSRFKIEGKLSESYADELEIGGAVKVRTGNQDLEGIISVVKPEVTNGQVSFEVSLKNSNAAGLRPKLQVEVMVITAYKEDILIVKNGAFYKGKKDQKVFVIQENKAVMHTVDIGLTNLDYVEVKGLEEGNELILNEMNDYENAFEVNIIRE